MTEHDIKTYIKVSFGDINYYFSSLNWYSNVIRNFYKKTTSISDDELWRNADYITQVCGCCGSIKFKKDRGQLSHDVLDEYVTEFREYSYSHFNNCNHTTINYTTGECVQHPKEYLNVTLKRFKHTNFSEGEL